MLKIILVQVLQIAANKDHRAVLLFFANNEGYLPSGVDASSVLADAWVDDDLAVVVPHSLGLSNVD